jgi:hypothetical protein
MVVIVVMVVVAHVADDRRNIPSVKGGVLGPIVSYPAEK